MNFKPRSVAGQGGSAPSYSAAPGTGYGNDSSYGSAGYYGQQQSAGGYYGQAPGAGSHATPPQIQNPFSAPGTGPAAGSGAGAGRGFNNSSYDPEYEAQIAQWQSAYAARDDAKPSGVRETVSAQPAVPRATGNIDIGNQAAPHSGVAAVVSGADGKQQTVVRSGGGKTWQDSSLLEWDPSHPRLFIGNLAGEVTDDSLLKAFSAYASVQRARVIREKRTSKSKGYGFVSFGNSDDYFQAAKEMNGKYIGSHPVLIKRSTTEIKATNPNQRGGRHGKGGNRGGHAGGANTGAGVQKKHPKKKGGLKFLG